MKVIVKTGIAFVLTFLLLIAVAPATVDSGKQDRLSTREITKSASRLSRSSAVSGSRMSIEVIDMTSGKVLYSNGENRRLIPASNMKLLTSATALSLLRPDYQFRTEVWMDGPIKKGVVKGNLYIKGYGDPSLVDEHLWTIARDVAYRGILQIDGKIIADDSYFDRNQHGVGWGKIGSEAYYAPISALSLNFNTFVVTASPANKVGAPPKLFYMAPDKHLKLINRAMTVGGKGKSRIKVLDIKNKVNSYEVVGTVPVRSKTEEVRRTVGDPALYTAGSFEAYLISWGVAVSGSIDRGKVPKGATLLIERESEPLSQIIWDMGKFSNNFIAEQIVKTLCARHGQEGKRTPASTACGLKVMEQFLEKLEIEPGNYTIKDGSGLSRSNRISARQINKVLVAMYNDPVLWPEFAASLAVAGVDGTLEERFINSPLRGKVRAKTGHLTGVNALSGYLPTARGRMLAFSMIFNDFPGYHSSVEEVEERILEAFARY